MTLKHVFFMSSLIFFIGCESKLSVQDFSQLVVDSLSCENFEGKMFDSLLMAVDNDQALPTPVDLEAELNEDFKSIENYEKHSLMISQIILKFVKMYSDIYENHPVTFDSNAINKIKLYLMAIETRDQMSLSEIDFIDKYNDQLTTLQNLAQTLKQDCSDELKTVFQPTKADTLLDFIKSKHPKEVYGAYKTFATAYQNCEAANLKALDLKTAELKGVKVVGKHSSGVGNIREISSLRDVQKTHPYLNERPPPDTCFNTFQKPLIYDFGGKPKTINTQSSELNFFVNDGTGSKDLGTDCSGFIFSALVSAGLKLNSSVMPKARHVLSYNAARFVDPVKGKVTCFEKLPINPSVTIQPGDIVASSGHIFMITKTSLDPLGTKLKTTMDDCDNIDVEDFDFELMQSSPSLGAIGINKMKASEYLMDSEKMKIGMTDFATNICRSKFSNQASKQTSTKMSIVRHKKSAECMMNSEIKLTGQSCIYDCEIN